MAMSLEKRQQISAERTRQIQEAAIEIFDQKGYSNTTISDIASAAGISNGLVYHYFSSKENILSSYGELIQECEQHVQNHANALEALVSFCSRILLDYEETNYHSPIKILITTYVLGEVTEADWGFDFHNYGKTFVANLIKRGQEEGLFKEKDYVMTGDILWHTIIGYTIHRIKYKNENITVPDIREMILSIVN